MGAPLADVLLLTAKRLEQAAVLQVLAGDQQIGQCRVAHASLKGQGNVNAAHEARNAIDSWSPAYVFLTGIAASVRQQDGVELGDVLVAEQMIGYEIARDVPGGVHPRWELYRPDWRLLQLARSMDAREWTTRIQQPRPPGRRGFPMVHFGPIASGEKVHAGGSGMEGLRTAWPAAVGVEMESIGVALATYRTESRPQLLVAKAVSDFADAAKDDRWQPYAAEVAMQFVAAIIRRLPAPTASPVPAHYDGPTKVRLCRALTDDWQELADYVGIRPDERARFEQGRGPHRVWDWLAHRGRLHELPVALADLGLTHLVAILL